MREEVALEDLDLAPNALIAIEEGLSRTRGLVLLSGSTGSGKKTLARALLKRLGDERPTVPLEGALEGAAAQSLSIVYAGEIRGPQDVVRACETARNRLVLAILRSGSSRFALVRLVALGVPKDLVAEIAPVIITLQLCSSLCKACRRPRRVQADELAKARLSPEALSLTDHHVYDPMGCSECEGGYRGRVLLVEVLGSDLARKAGIARDGLVKVMAGITSMQELNRVLPEQWGGEYEQQWQEDRQSYF